MRLGVLCARCLLALVLGAFFAFVGWMKAFAPLSELKLHHAWTVWIPEALGRAVGWSEMIGGTLLVVSLAIGRLAAWHRCVALYFIANQIAAGAVHLTVGETGALAQNAVLIAGFACLAVTVRRPNFEQQRESTA